MAYLANKDSNHIKQNLKKLQNEKRLLTQMLANIRSKKREMFRQFDRKKSETMKIIESRNKLMEELNELRNESDIISQSARRIEANINQRRDCVKQLKSELSDKQKHQSAIIDSFASDLDQLTKQFMDLALIHSCGQIANEIKEMDKQIKAKYEKRLLLQQKLDEVQEDFNNYLSKSELKTAPYKWSDWPLRERMIAYDIFIEENQLVHEELIRLREFRYY